MIWDKFIKLQTQIKLLILETTQNNQISLKVSLYLYFKAQVFQAVVQVIKTIKNPKQNLEIMNPDYKDNLKNQLARVVYRFNFRIRKSVTL